MFTAVAVTPCNLVMIWIIIASIHKRQELMLFLSMVKHSSLFISRLIFLIFRTTLFPQQNLNSIYTTKIKINCRVLPMKLIMHTLWVRLEYQVCKPPPYQPQHITQPLQVPWHLFSRLVILIGIV